MNRALNVLHLEDDATDAELVEETLRGAGIPCEISRVQDRTGFVAALQSGPWDLILADYRLPAFDGLTALQLLTEGAQETPFIFVTGAMDEDAVVQTLKRGATDYVLKTHLSKLPSAVESALQKALERQRHKRAEEATQASLAAIVESSDDAIIAKTVEGTITAWNKAAERLYGYRKEDALGKPISIIVPPDRAEELAHIMQTIRRGQGVNRLETVRLRSDGTGVDVSVTISPIKDREGKLIGASSIARDISDRKRQDERIQASLQEKELLLKEIHHRVKNNLQVISSLLQLAGADSQDREFREILRDSQSRVRTMALIHEKLYQSKDFAHVDFGEYVRSLVVDLFHSYRPDPDSISLSVRADRVLLGVDTAVPCALIVNELVSNSLKHAFNPVPSGEPEASNGDTAAPVRASGQQFNDGGTPGGLPKHRGIISVALSLGENNRARLVVSDNGAGFPKSLDFRHTKSLGLQLVTTLTGQLGGTIEMHTGQGTEFQIEFAA